MNQDTSAQVSELQGLTPDHPELDIVDPLETEDSKPEIDIAPITKQGRKLNCRAWRLRNFIQWELHESGKLKCHKAIEFEVEAEPEKIDPAPFVPMTLEQALIKALS